MERRFVLFLVLSFAILFVHFALMPKPPKKPAAKPEVAAKEEEQAPRDEPGPQPAPPELQSEKPEGDQPAADDEQPEPAQAAETGPTIIPPKRGDPRKWVCLGSSDPTSPYRMLVTLTTRGAAVARIEMASPRYRELEDRSGHLGHLVMDATRIPDALRGEGCPVQIVGPGTPAAKAGLKPGDLIQLFDGQEVTGVVQFRSLLRRTRWRQQVELGVLRDGKPLKLSATLGRRPLEVVRPEANDPLSLLVTLDRVGDEQLVDVQTRNTLVLRMLRELDVREQQLAELELKNLKLSEGRVKILQKGRREADWVDLSPDTAESLQAWMAVRGKQPGPVFVSLADRQAPKPVTPQAIEWIAAQLKTDSPEDADKSRFLELDGLDLRSGDWELVSAGTTEAVFRRRLPGRGLEVLKTYRLEEVPQDAADDSDFPAYHLDFELTLRNVGHQARKVAYQLDGPTGLPTEGWWYANKIGREGFFGGAAGLRDVVIMKDQYDFRQIGCPKIAKDEFGAPGKDPLLRYIGVDAQYFSAVLIPQKGDPQSLWFSAWEAMRVGRAPKDLLKMTNTTCRLTSQVVSLEPDDELTHRFQVFAGPKKPPLLSHYELDELVYYGWFGFIAKPLVKLLHIFHYVLPYGLAIILLTVVVRGAMFPLSRKQAIGAQKMAQIQPELKRIQEQYKNNMEGRSKAQQELFRKHNYNPASGCLVMFVQLPIFIALYRSLMVDVELRQAPLISESIRWCSNLAAPDMLYDWSGFMPEWIANGQGLFGLGPYFNLLPILTILLFIGQQKVLMPPPADEQAAMQQKIMKYMMLFMGLLFFKVASGLCIYFIASSLWGLGERQFLPKPAKGTAAEVKPVSRADAKARARAEAQAEAEAKTKAKASPADSDGAAARRRRKQAKRGKR